MFFMLLVLMTYRFSMEVYQAVVLRVSGYHHSERQLIRLNRDTIKLKKL